MNHLAIIELKERLPKIDWWIKQIDDEETAERFLQQIGVVYGRAKKKYLELKEVASDDETL